MENSSNLAFLQVLRAVILKIGGWTFISDKEQSLRKRIKRIDVTIE
jgi:hypothetical protein